MVAAWIPGNNLSEQVLKLTRVKISNEKFKPIVNNSDQKNSKQMRCKKPLIK